MSVRIVRVNYRWETSEGKNVWISMQNYKSLRVVVTICATMVNTHTDKQLLTGCTTTSAS